MTAAADYAEKLLTITMQIIGAVHDDGPDELLRHYQRALAVPAPPGVDPHLAMVTILAAQVDPTATTATRVGWVEGYDPERVAPAGGSSGAGIAGVRGGQLALAELSIADRALVIAQLTAQGLGVHEIAERTGASRKTISRYRNGRAHLAQAS